MATRYTRKIFWSVTRYFSNGTIFALSSGQGKCGVAVLRVSGASSGEALKAITARKSLPEPRLAILSSIRNPKTQEVIDKGLILWFPGPRSFTGEDSFELQVHGSVAVVNAILKSLGTLPRLRLAEPGEFTKRAFHNGKLDLTEVEGLADLLQAETEAQLKQAFFQSQGALSKLYNRWRQVLLRSVAHMEADIDFNETEDIDQDLLLKISYEISELNSELKQHLNDGRRGEILRSGARTIILGEPNVGKSSLLNLLSQRPAAIVSPQEGTTRDLLEITLNINGYPLVLIDTAGLRNETKDSIEIEGITRALQSFKLADLVILVIDAIKYIKWKSKNNGDIISYIKQYVQTLNLSELIKFESTNIDTMFNKPCLVVINKIDLVSLGNKEVLDITHISCRTEDGITNLVESLTEQLKSLCGEPSKEHPSMNQMRHKQHLLKCSDNLEFFLQASSSKYIANLDTVLLAEYLRKALRSLGKLVGTNK